MSAKKSIVENIKCGQAKLWREEVYYSHDQMTLGYHPITDSKIPLCRQFFGVFGYLQKDRVTLVHKNLSDY
jgi:hypothetical protein